MANENRASYFSIGLIVFLGLVGIAGTLIYIGGLRGNGDEILVETYSSKPVGGLSVGSAVNFRGVKIGEVREIAFVGNKYDVQGVDNTRIYLLLAIKRRLFDEDGRTGEEVSDAEVLEGFRVLVRAGFRATVSVNGLTGIAKIDCDLYPGDVPENVPWRPAHLLIPPRVSLLENFADSATKVMNQINKMDFNVFWSNVSASAESISAMTMSTRRLMEGYQPEFDRMVKNLEETTSALREFSDTIRRDPSTLLRGETPSSLPETAR